MEKGDKKKTVIIILIVLAVALLAVAGFVIYKVAGNNQTASKKQESSNITGDNMSNETSENAAQQDIHWLAIGDSITAGEGNNFISYADYISDIYSIDMTKRSWGGIDIVRLRELTDTGFLDIDMKPNLVTVLIGANDFGGNLPLNEFDDNMSQYMDTLSERYPDARIVFLTPLYRDYFGGVLPTMGGQINDIGISLYEYRDVIVNQGKQHNIEVIDLTGDDFLNADNIREYTTDGLHPNEAGNKMIAEKLYNLLFTGNK